MIKRFLADRSANFGVMAAILMIPLLLAVGTAVDYSRLVSARSHLQTVTDAAALALAASTEQNANALRSLADKLVSANAAANAQFPNVSITEFDADKDRVALKTKVELPTYFMGLVNIKTMKADAEAWAERAVSGSVEVALVLDNTASMEAYDKIGTLRTAATDLVEKLFSEKDANVRIGLVPYADNINVGTANRHASWLSVPQDYQTTPGERVCEDVEVTQKPCLRSETYACTKTVDGVTKPATCKRCIAHGPEVTKTERQCTGGGNPVSYSWKGCIGARVSGGALILNDLSPGVRYPGFLDANKNRRCLSEITPLSAYEATVHAAITAMTTSSPGYTANTYIPGGMIWGVNMLSPAPPITEGAAYDPDNLEPRKVIVLMTDGLNSRRVIMSGKNRGGFQNANAKQQIQVNKDTEAVCKYAKSKKIEIFSVAFMVDDKEAKTMLQNCATDAEHYYDASDSEKMLLAFDGIAQSLKLVRLTR